MEEINLLPHQQDCISITKEANRVAYYLDMGLGKTFVGSEKMRELGGKINLLVCQKSLIPQWVSHFNKFYSDYELINCTKTKLDILAELEKDNKFILIVNYELIFRRDYFSKLKDITLILDESSLIQNENSKRSKAILRLAAKNVILLSGTPTGGKYEKLWSQCSMLGWNISKREFYDRYIIEREIMISSSAFPIKIVVGYKNVDELKAKLREHNAIFMKTEEVITLPEQVEITLKCGKTREYDKFIKDSVVDINDIQLVGNISLTKLLYARQLCGMYNPSKYEAFSDFLDSTDDRLIVFYNFKEEYEKLKEIADRKGRPISVISGDNRNLDNYETKDNSITLIQYQAGSMGLNLQKANKIMYFSPTHSSEMFEQSKKRTHRIGQNKTCLYYYLVADKTVEEHIYEVLKTRCDYTNDLFKI